VESKGREHREDPERGEWSSSDDPVGGRLRSYARLSPLRIAAFGGMEMGWRHPLLIVVNLIVDMAAELTHAPWEDLRWRTLTLTDRRGHPGWHGPVESCAPRTRRRI
jgi:hypothetical protein